MANKYQPGCKCCGCKIASFSFPPDEEKDSHSTTITEGEHEGWKLLTPILPVTRWIVTADFSHVQNAVPLGSHDIAHLDFDILDDDGNVLISVQMVREVHKKQFTEDLDDYRNSVAVTVKVGEQEATTCRLTYTYNAPSDVYRVYLQYEGDRLMLFGTRHDPVLGVPVTTYNAVEVESDENPLWPAEVLRGSTHGFRNSFRVDIANSRSRIANTTAGSVFWQMNTPENFAILRFNGNVDSTEGLDSKVVVKVDRTRDREAPLLTPCFLVTPCTVNSPSFSTPRWELAAVQTPTGPLVIGPPQHDYTDFNRQYADSNIHDGYGDIIPALGYYDLPHPQDPVPIHRRIETDSGNAPEWTISYNSCFTLYDHPINGTMRRALRDLIAINAIFKQPDSEFYRGGGSWNQGGVWYQPSFRISLDAKDDVLGEADLTCWATMGFFALPADHKVRTYFPWQRYISPQFGNTHVCVDVNGRKYIKSTDMPFDLWDDIIYPLPDNATVGELVPVAFGGSIQELIEWEGIEYGYQPLTWITLKYQKTVPLWRGSPPAVTFGYADLVGYRTNPYRDRLQERTFEDLTPPSDLSRLHRWVVFGNWAQLPDRHHILTSASVSFTGQTSTFDFGTYNWERHMHGTLLELENFSVSWNPATHDSLLQPNYP